MKNAHPVVTEVSAMDSLILSQATQQAKRGGNHAN